jgi:hypothetical protein
MRDERYSKFSVNMMGRSEIHYSGGAYDEVDLGDVGDLGDYVQSDKMGLI